MNVRQVTATLIAISLLAAGCSGNTQQAASPGPTQAAPAATAAPANTAAPTGTPSRAAPMATARTAPTPSPVAASPTAVPKKAPSATPATGQSTGSAPAAQAKASLPKLPADATDCGTNMDCFIQAAKNAHPAKVDIVTPPADPMGLGILVSTTYSLGITGKDGNKVGFYDVISKASAKLSDQGIQTARKAGKNDADIQKFQADAQAAVGQYAYVGMGMECKFAQQDLTAALQKMKSDPTSFDPASQQCTQIGTPAVAGSTNGATGAQAVSDPSISLPEPPADATDCGSGADLSCMIQASQSGHPAKFVYVIPPTEIFGMVTTSSQYLAITGKEANKLLFSMVIVGGHAKVDDMIALSARMEGKSEAEIGAAADQANASIKETFGTGKSCKYAQADLTGVLQAWKQGTYSTTDWDKGQCTDIKPSKPAPKLADPSVLPAELKSMPVPPGFGVVDGSPKREPAEGGAFSYALADWFGTMSVADVQAFYKQALASDWSVTGEGSASSGDTLEVFENSYDSEKDSSLSLTVTAQEEAPGTRIEIKLEKR